MSIFMRPWYRQINIDMPKFTIHRDEIPEDIQTEKYIFRKTGSYQKWEEIKNQVKWRKVEMKLHDTDFVRLRKDTLEVLDQLKFRGWNSVKGPSEIYGGLSFVCNPRHKDGIDPDESTLGAPKNARDQFFWNQTSNYNQLKDTYFDSYGFTKRTTLANYGYIKEFLDSKVKRTMIRSRLGVLKNHVPDSSLAELNWHRDEIICQNIRINIPITTSPEYMFEMEGNDVYHLELGKVYTWDTNIAHRVLLTNPAPIDRVHFVLGFSPWFDYDENNQCWVSNEFWGKHPFQMLIDGDVFSGLEILKAE